MATAYYVRLSGQIAGSVFLSRESKFFLRELITKSFGACLFRQSNTLKRNKGKVLPDHEKSKNELIQNPSFRRWAKGEASKEEKLFWDRWVMKSPENRSVAMRAQEEMEGFSLQSSETVSTDDAWDHLQSRIGRPEMEKVTRFFTDSKETGEGDGLVWILRAAAVFVLAAVTGVLVLQLYQNPDEGVVEAVREEVRTDIGEQKTVSFSDGSKIILNGRSGIVYTTDQDDPTAIEIYLEGEAFFSVASREKLGNSPFRVRTGQGIVSVMGTRFAVSVRDETTRVVLEEGRVEVEASHLDEKTMMEPGQLARFSRQSETVALDFVNTEVYTSWIDGRLAFEKTSLTEVAERLETTFGVKVIITEPGLEEELISGSIENSDIAIITSALSEMLDSPINRPDAGEVIYIGNTTTRH